MRAKVSDRRQRGQCTQLRVSHSRHEGGTCGHEPMTGPLMAKGNEVAGEDVDDVAATPGGRESPQEEAEDTSSSPKS